MDLESSFSVVAPIDTVWQTLMDFDRIAGSVPGAEILNRLSDDAFQVGMKVKLGPVTLQYKGLVNVVERDLDLHKAVFSGKAQETRGQGTAAGSATLILTEADGTTTGRVTADLALSGKAAAMGKSIINSVAEQMMALFAQNLQAMVSEDATEPTATGASPETGDAIATADTAASSAVAATADTTATADATSTPRPSTGPTASVSADNSLDAFTLAKGVIADQLSNPVKLAALIAVVALVAFAIGRRSGR